MLDHILLPVLVLTILIGGIFAVYMYHQIVDPIRTELESEGLDSTTSAEIFAGANTAINVYAQVVPAIALSLYVVSLITSFFVKNHPVLIWFSFLFVTIAIVISVIAKGVLDEMFAAMPALETQLSSVPWIVANWTIVAAMMGLFNIFILFYRYQAGDQ